MKKLIFVLLLLGVSECAYAGYAGGGGTADNVVLDDASNFQSYPDTITVSGAGTTNINGVYVYDDDLGYWTKGFFNLLISGSEAIIGVGDPINAGTYRAVAINGLPPKTGWYIGSPYDTSEPSPTLSYSLPVQAFVTALGIDSGLSGTNKFYYYSAVSNTTTYIITQWYDATNDVFKFTKVAE